jgi:predicted RNA-binding Zn ribbon-like protein
MDHGMALLLELANTAPMASLDRRDPLDGPAGLSAWIGAHADLLGDPSDDVALRVSDFRGVRDSIRDLLDAVVAGEPVPLDAVQRVNAVSASVPAWIELDPTDRSDPAVLEVHAAVGRTVAMLGSIARAAILLVGSTDRQRLRRCPAPRCGRFFLEGRRGTVWCSTACGNRVRVARHHARRVARGLPRS